MAAIQDTTMKRNVLNGFYRGQVLKHCAAGKCKIWIPSVYDEEVVMHPEILPDAEQASPIFGGSSNGSGIFSYPRINSIVWCFFQNGDQNFPVYFACCNGGPEGIQQYKDIGPEGEYEQYEKEHDNIIDVTDKISDAEVHRINVSKGQISFYEDGSIATTVVKTNPLRAPYNVNLPYSQSNHIFNDLCSVIFPGKVEDAIYVSDSEYPYHTENLISGLNNTSFGISCNIRMSPVQVYNEITSKIGACCDKGYKTQCRYVYGKDVDVPYKMKKQICFYQHNETYAVPYLPYLTFGEMFSQLYGVDQEISRDYKYVVMQQPGQKLFVTMIEGVILRTGDVIEVIKKVTPATITKKDIKILDLFGENCRTFIAAEDCKIDKWKYILSSQYDLYLCSPTQFDNPVLYFDKPLDEDYKAQCPNKVWPKLVDKMANKYKTSIILMEDRRKYTYCKFDKNGTIGHVLSDSYDESYVQDRLSATGDYEYHAFKQDYLDWNKTHDYYKGESVQAKISGYNAMNMGFANDDNKHNGYISCWNYQVRQAVPKNSSKWQYYNNFFEWDQQNGLCCFNNNLSIDDKPEYWQKHIGESTCWPRWKHKTAIDPKLREHISCGYYMNVNEGIAAWNFGHLSTKSNLGDVMSFSRMSADYNGNISVEATKEFDMLLTDVRHSDHPKHCGGNDETWSDASPLSDLVPGIDATDKMISHKHSSLPGTEPYIHNEWTHIKFTREGEISAHTTKFIELSCADPYKQYSFTHMLMKSDGTLSVNNSGQINLMTMMPPAKRDIPESAIPKGCCDWPIKAVPKHDTIRGDNTDWPFAKFGLRNDGDVDIDAYHQIDLFANPNQYWGRTWQSQTKSVNPGAGKASDPPAPPRAHLRLTGGPKNTANTKDIVDPSHKTVAGESGTIMGDSCNLIQFFSSNGNIELENGNGKGPSDIIIQNTGPTNGIFLYNNYAAIKGIELDNKVSGPIMIHTASGDITIQTSKGNMKIEAVGNITVHCTGNMTTNVDGNLKANVGGTTTINSSGAMTLKAPTITLDGEVTCTKNVKINGGITCLKNVQVASNITAGGKIKDSGCTLATHIHPVIDTYTGGGTTKAGVG